MNGAPNGQHALLLWAVNALVSLLTLLLGIMLRMLKASFDTYRAQAAKDLDDLRIQQTKDLDTFRAQCTKDIELHTKEIDLVRQRLHNHGNRVAGIITRMRWQEEDKSKGE